MHGQNLIHYDLKGSNVLVDKSTSKVTLIDFSTGQVNRKDLQTVPKGATFVYMPPEYLLKLRELMAPATDAWQVGVMLLEAVSKALRS